MRHPEAQLVLSSAPGVDRAIADLPVEKLKQTATDFKADGRSGFNDAEFIAEAYEASKLRANGEFDEMANDKFASFWAEEDGEEE